MPPIEKFDEAQFINRVLGLRCLATDPIGMEFAIDPVDPAIRNQLMAVRLETVASVYRNIAEGAAKAAKVVAAARE